MSRKTKQDWCYEALLLLIEHGADALTIENLTARLGVTKGSFYHHFGSYEGFKQALLDYFVQEGTLNIAKRVSKMATTPAKRLQALLKMTLEHPATIEVAIRTWAQRDTMVRDYQVQIDANRIAYVTQLWLEMLDDPAEAHLRAQLLYVILVGAEHVMPPIEGLDKQHLYDTYLRLYSLVEDEE